MCGGATSARLVRGKLYHLALPEVPLSYREGAAALGLTTNHPAHVHPAARARVAAGRDIAQKSAMWIRECGSHNGGALLWVQGQEGCHRPGSSCVYS